MKKFLCFCCVLLWSFGLHGVAGAAPIQYELQGTFNDGGPLSGTFYWDYDTKDVTDLEVTTGVGTLFDGMTYVYASVLTGGAEEGLSGLTLINYSQYYVLTLGFQDMLINGNPSNLRIDESVYGERDQYGETESFLRVLSTGNVAQAAVPEPSSLLLLGSGVVWLVGYGRKKFRK